MATILYSGFQSATQSMQAGEPGFLSYKIGSYVTCLKELVEESTYIMYVKI